jgi:diphosphomevalonate decarboxylase
LDDLQHREFTKSRYGKLPPMGTATSVANPNIAFIKYWGDQDQTLHIPSNGSISMNLDGLFSRTTVNFDPLINGDELVLDGQQVNGPAVERVSLFLDHVRQMASVGAHARVESENNFPTGSGIASSASAFAALSLAASTAAGLSLDEQELSRLARRGSGSACRSVPGGFVEWLAGQDDASSYAVSISPQEHWDLTDCIAVVSQEHKETGSREGHTLAETSLLQDVRVGDANRRLTICRQAILERDFNTFAEIVEFDSNLMHSVMMTSQPRLLYWQPATLSVMQAVVELRESGIPACYTIDAGPNVHVLTPSENVSKVISELIFIPGVIKVLSATPGAAVQLVVE